MESIIKEENVGTVALRNLRKQKFAMGFPFMINVIGLADFHCYFEYPDGSMYLMMLDNTKKDFTQVEKLSVNQANQILLENNLIS
jgi:hypothetical protein